MTNLTFWDADHDSIAAMEESLSNANDVAPISVKDLFQRGYTQPEIDQPGGLTGFVSSAYKHLDEDPLKNFDRIYAVRMYQLFTSDKEGSSLVGACLFHPIHKRFNEFYLVASTQEHIGIYMDGEQIAEVLKASPVIVPDMLRPYLLGVPSLDLDAFCKEASDAAKRFLDEIKGFEL